MNTENADTTAHTTGLHRRLLYVAGTIVNDVEAAPMGYCYDGGERARHTAERIERMYEQSSRERAEAILDTLDIVLAESQASAAEDAQAAGDRSAPLSREYHQGRTAAHAEARREVARAKQALAGLNPGNTRQANAQAFAETIINGHTAKDTQ